MKVTDVLRRVADNTADKNAKEWLRNAATLVDNLVSDARETVAMIEGVDKEPTLRKARGLEGGADPDALVWKLWAHSLLTEKWLDKIEGVENRCWICRARSEELITCHGSAEEGLGDPHQACPSCHENGYHDDHRGKAQEDVCAACASELVDMAMEERQETPCEVH